jgi:hypothetical protein
VTTTPGPKAGHGTIRLGVQSCFGINEEYSSSTYIGVLYMTVHDSVISFLNSEREHGREVKDNLDGQKKVL